MPKRILAFLCLLLFVSMPFAAHAQLGVALVIGNSAYRHIDPLRNPKRDAESVAEALRQLGFEVLIGTDLSKVETERIVQHFADRLLEASLGVIFYAGHAVQIGGLNYLVPVEAEFAGEGDAQRELVELELIQWRMEMAAQANVLLIDGCRDNAMALKATRAGSKMTALGLAPPKGQGTLISYSTQPGSFAKDGDGDNSPYTSALVRHLRTPTKPLGDILADVRRDVAVATNNEQIPWEYANNVAPIFLTRSAQGRIQSANGGVTDKAVSMIMEYAWAMTPARYKTSDGKEIVVDKTRKSDVLVPIDLARDIVFASRRSSFAQICDLPELQVVNYNFLISRERAKNRWTDQQLLYVVQLHVVSVAMQTGNIKIVDGDGSASFSLSAPRFTCSHAQRDAVMRRIMAYARRPQ